MSLSEETIVTVITKQGKMNSPEMQALVAAGAELWSDEHCMVSHGSLLKERPSAPFKSMRSLYGSQAGKTMFICGSGPSLKDAPARLPGFTLAINRAITHVKADIWCFGDVAAHTLFKDHPNAKGVEMATGAGMHLVFPNDPIYLIEADGKPSRHKNEAKRPLYWSVATFSWVLHWAIKMQPKRIILVGCDYTVGNHFDGAEAHGHTGDSSLMVFRIARGRVDDMFGPDKAEWFDPNVEILDACQTGYLPVPKTKLEDWL